MAHGRCNTKPAVTLPGTGYQWPFCQRLVFDDKKSSLQRIYVEVLQPWVKASFCALQDLIALLLRHLPCPNMQTPGDFCSMHLLTSPVSLMSDSWNQNPQFTWWESTALTSEPRLLLNEKLINCVDVEIINAKKIQMLFSNSRHPLQQHNTETLFKMLYWFMSVYIQVNKLLTPTWLLVYV